MPDPLRSHTLTLPMTSLLRLSPLAFLLVALSLVLAACGTGTTSTSKAPTPAGLPENKPTFVYLYTFP